MAYSELSADYSPGAGMGNVTGLSFAIGANEVWVAEFTLFASATGGTTLQVQLTGPASPLEVRVAVAGYGVYSAADTPINDATATAFGTPQTALHDSDFAHNLVRVVAAVRNGVNAGTVQLQASGSGTVVRKRSFLLARNTAQLP